MTNETALLQQAIQGNIAAFTGLETKYRHKIYRVLYFMSLDENEALDVLHETFLVSYQSLSRIENPAGFLHFLLKTALQLTIDFIKNRDRFQKHKSVKRQISSETTKTIDAKTPLRQVISALPFEQKSALVLHDIEKYSYRQITEILGCGRKAIVNRLSGARNSLRKRLRDTKYIKCRAF